MILNIHLLFQPSFDKTEICFRILIFEIHNNSKTNEWLLLLEIVYIKTFDTPLSPENRLGDWTHLVRGS